MPTEPKCPRCFNELSAIAGVLGCRCCGYRDLIGPQATQDRDVIICGLDLGKMNDPSAFTAWRRRVDPKSHDAHYAAVVVHRWELGTSYHGTIVPKTIEMMQSQAMKDAFLVIDFGAVGPALIELFQVEGLWGRTDAVQSTGGTGYKYDSEKGHWNVSKVFLCSLTQKLLSGDRVHVRESDSVDAKQYPKLSAKSLEQVPQLKSELLNFREKHNPRTGGTQFEAKGSTHDDLAMSAAIAFFIGERGGFGGIDDRPNEEARGLVARMPRDAWGADMPPEPGYQAWGQP